MYDDSGGNNDGSVGGGGGGGDDNNLMLLDIYLPADRPKNEIKYKQIKWGEKNAMRFYEIN